jgi:hypothetical protein
MAVLPLVLRAFGQRLSTANETAYRSGMAFQRR